MKTSLTSVAVLLTLLAGPANAAFIGDYDLAKWIKAVNGNGLITTNTAADSVTLVSANGGPGGPTARNQDFTVTAAASGLVKFDWAFSTADALPSRDPFGWLLNGVFTQLTNNTGGRNQSAVYSFNVQAGDIFGFRAASTTSRNGAATTVITNFSGPTAVPLPATAWLMVAPMMALLRKRKATTV